MKMYDKLFLIAVAGIVTGLTATDATAQSVKKFYTDRKISFLVGFGAGGGYDAYARTISRHMGKHIPGNPTLVVQNMPGAGSLKLANHLYNVAPKDGSVIGSFASGIPTAPLLNPNKAKFNAANFTWLGSANKEIYIAVVWHKSPVQTLDALKRKTLIVGATGPGAATDDFPTLVNAILGLKFKLVKGYKGTKRIYLAMERGEVHGVAGTTWTSVSSRLPTWVRDKKIKVIVQYSKEKHPALPHVPSIFDLVKTEKDRKALNLLFARQAYGRPYVAPPGLPKDRAQALQRGFMATMKDPAFLADAKKRRLEINPLPGAAVAKLVSEVYKTPKAIVDRVRGILTEGRK